MEERRKRRLGDLLSEMKMLTEADLERALAEGRAKGVRLGEALIELGILTEDQILWTLAEQLGLSYIRITEGQVLAEVVRLVPEEMARRHRVLPLIRIGNELTLAVNDPLEDELFSDISRLTRGEVRLCLAKAEDISQALDRVYGQAAARRKGPAEMRSSRYSKDELRTFSLDKGGARLLTRLVQDGLAEGVDKIHLDVREKEAAIRFRKDLRLEPVLTMDPEYGRALLTRLAILAKTPAEPEATSLRVEIPIEKQPVVIEVHQQKVQAGEIATLRLLGKRAHERPFAKLGLTPAQRVEVDALLAAPGLVVISGPSSSGRATTVMSLLQRFDPLRRRIITAEDWVRMEHPAYAQVQRDSRAGRPRLDHLLSLDSDVMYVESLTSPAEVEAALRAGMAGTFVFTLMGFRRAASALTYLSTITITPALVADGLSGIIAQQRIRRLCDKCKVKVKLKKSQLEGLKPERQKLLIAGPVYKAKGCQACAGLGFVGREAVFEVLALDQEIKQAVTSGISMTGLPLIGQKINPHLPDRVLAKIREGVCDWTEILAFR